MLKGNIFLILYIASFVSINAFAKTDALMEIVEREMLREFKVLEQQSPAAYYMAYRVDHVNQYSLSSSFGNITGSSNSESRFLTPIVRVGDHTFDNTHLIKGDGGSVGSSGVQIPIDDVPIAIQQEIWKQTDLEYKKAKSAYLAKMNKIKPDEQNLMLDFSKEEARNYFEEENPTQLSDSDMAKWKKIIKSCSKHFLQDEQIMLGDVDFEFVKNRKYFLSTEGTRVAQNTLYARFVISGVIRSDEGNQMPLYKSFYAETPDELPSEKELVAATKNVVEKLIELKNAPLAKPYTGPAILSAQASGVFFHEIFGHRVEGHRLKDETDGQTFKHKLNERVLPKSIHVTFDPTKEYLDSTYLIGHYSFDDEGVASKPVQVVEKGVLRNFLQSRTPITGFSNSNGHGRASVGASAVARQSNMFVTTSKPLSDSKMRKKLIKECKKQKVEYGYFFKEVTGGFTQTGRYMPNAFNVIPTEVYRVYVDGRPDELVRGVDLIGTPLAMFSAIEAAGDKMDVFTGFCGAESGWVPVSAASPSLFVRKIETQRKSQVFSKKILLSPPSLN